MTPRCTCGHLLDAHDVKGCCVVCHCALFTPNRTTAPVPTGCVTSLAMRDAFRALVQDDPEWLDVYDEMNAEISRHRTECADNRFLIRELESILADQANQLRELRRSDAA